MVDEKLKFSGSKEIPSVGRTVHFLGLNYGNFESPEASSARYSTMVSYIEQALRNNAETDFLLLPEYLLFKTPDVGLPITFEYQNDEYVVVGGDPVVREIIQSLTNLAQKYQVSICPGTVCEAEQMGEETVFHNTSIIIGSDGRIVQRRRKITGSDSVRYQDSEVGLSSALSTVDTCELKTKTGESYTVALAICAESTDREFYKLLAEKGIKADVIIDTHSEGGDFRLRNWFHTLMNFDQIDQSYEVVKQEKLEQYAGWIASYKAQLEFLESKPENEWSKRHKQGIRENLDECVQERELLSKKPAPSLGLCNLAVESGVLQPRGVMFVVDGSHDAGLVPASSGVKISDFLLTQDMVKATCVF